MAKMSFEPPQIIIKQVFASIGSEVCLAKRVQTVVTHMACTKYGLAGEQNAYRLPLCASTHAPTRANPTPADIDELNGIKGKPPLRAKVLSQSVVPRIPIIVA